MGLSPFRSNCPAGLWPYAALGLAMLFSPLTIHAQTAITAATFGATVNNADQTKYTNPPVTFLETSSALTTFTTAGGVYGIQNNATNAYVRRNTSANLNNSSVWYNGASTSTLDGNYKPR